MCLQVSMNDLLRSMLKCVTYKVYGNFRKVQISSKMREGGWVGYFSLSWDSVYCKLRGISQFPGSLTIFLPHQRDR